MKRRTFHAGLLLVPLAYGCAAVAGVLSFLSPLPVRRRQKRLDAGEVAEYLPDAPPRVFRCFGPPARKVFVLHDGDAIRAFDAECTHLACNIGWPQPSEPGYAEYEGSFRCYCHGARFDRGGQATKGPATEPLREYEIADPAANGGRVIVLNREKAV